MGNSRFQIEPLKTSLENINHSLNLKMDAANMSGTFMMGTSRRMSNVSSSSTGSGSGMASESGSSGMAGTSYGSSYGSSAGSYMVSGMKDMFKRQDSNDTMNGGLSQVHKYMSPF